MGRVGHYDHERAADFLAETLEVRGGNGRTKSKAGKYNCKSKFRSVKHLLAGILLPKKHLLEQFRCQNHIIRCNLDQPELLHCILPKVLHSQFQRAPAPQARPSGAVDMAHHQRYFFLIQRIKEGIRFIAINDDVDSEHHNQSDDLLIPVKNLINETYCRELSQKLRAQFELQRRNGEFLGAFAAYGYRKSPDDRHVLIIDEYAAQVVRDIFAFKMQGYSQQSIADALNQMGIPSPSEYKKQSGLNYKTGFRTAGKSLWSAITIRRILTNTLYIGELTQGKRGTPNYKIKTMKERKPDDWVVVEHNHEPIVDELMFSVVQKLLQRDTRTAPGGKTVQPFSGFVFCGECKRPMRRRTVTRGGKKFHYFTCERHVGEQTGKTHNFSEKKLEAAVLHAIQNQIQTVIEADQLIRKITQTDLLRLN